MPDLIDAAQERQALLIQEALHQKSITEAEDPDEEPLVIDGVRCCLDCERPIPAGRLAIKPEALRCVPCQSKKERKP